MPASESANLALRFALEIITLAALAYFGLVTFIPLALALPAIGVWTWGTYIAPRAKKRLEDPARLVVEVVFFASGVVALALAGPLWPALILALAVVLHISLMVGLKQR